LPAAPLPVVAAAASVDKSILEDEGNVGSRMLLNMGYQKGQGLGKDGTGIVEPVRAKGAQLAADKGGVGAAGNGGGGMFPRGGTEAYETAEARAAVARARYEASLS
jgi:RNA-binding protein 5/10